MFLQNNVLLGLNQLECTHILHVHSLTCNISSEILLSNLRGYAQLQFNYICMGPLLSNLRCYTQLLYTSNYMYVWVLFPGQIGILESK